MIRLSGIFSAFQIKEETPKKQSNSIEKICEKCAKLHQNWKLFAYFFKTQVLAGKSIFSERLRYWMKPKTTLENNQEKISAWNFCIIVQLASFMVEKNLIVEPTIFLPYMKYERIMISLDATSVSLGLWAHTPNKSRAFQMYLRKGLLFQTLNYSWKKLCKESCQVETNFYSHCFLNSKPNECISAKKNSIKDLNQGQESSRSNFCCDDNIWKTSVFWKWKKISQKNPLFTKLFVVSKIHAIPQILWKPRLVIKIHSNSLHGHVALLGGTCVAKLPLLKVNVFTLFRQKKPWRRNTSRNFYQLRCCR